MKKCVLIVLDSLGIGAMPDAEDFGDSGSDTLGSLLKYKPKLMIPNLKRLGIGNITGVNLEKDPSPIGCYGRCSEMYAGKDTVGGHWEIAGCLQDEAFPTYPNGFPPSLVNEFERLIGRKILGNIPASGTEIIQLLGDEHCKTGHPIVYTSADSVFQIAAHEQVIPLDELYAICQTARQLLDEPYCVGRVIARPFGGSSGYYIRTGNRKDYPVNPPEVTILDALKASGFTVAGVGKIEDIFAGRGLTASNHCKDNRTCLEATISYMEETFEGLIFTNLVDFDSLYGHRNNVEGYAVALEEFDLLLPKIFRRLQNNDLLIITADHGCDPSTPSTDHSREYIPLLCYGSTIKQGVNIGTRETFSDIGASIMDFFGLPKWHRGRSFYSDIVKGE